MVAVTRPLADSLADAADPQHWLACWPRNTPMPNSPCSTRRSGWRASNIRAARSATPAKMFSHAVAAAAIVADLNLLADGGGGGWEIAVRLIVGRRCAIFSSCCR